MKMKSRLVNNADDTTMILDGSKKSFTSAVLDLELFAFSTPEPSLS